jgi:hypothetical protein
MDPGTRRKQKEQVLRDIEAWKKRRSERGFQDIVRNALDLELKYMRDLMRVFGVDRDEIRKWTAGKLAPPDFQQGDIIEQLHDSIEKDINA